MRFLQTLPLGLCLVVLVGTARADRERDDSKTKQTRGEVTQLNAKDNQFTIRSRDGKDMSFDATKSTEVRIDGKSAELGKLKQGMRVLVRYEVKDGKNQVVLVRTTIASSALREEVRDILREVKDLAFSQRDNYERRVRNALDRADDRIDELQERVGKAEGQTRAQLEESLKELRKKKEKLRTQLDKARSAKSDTWEQAKEEVRTALEELQEALQRATPGGAK